eukprot:NODE_2088_length_656_cov_54.964083_g2038_i0.p1 GENE.NODE_2088_length_656_cov_54.964083_g2038_i0~~NODE_2088_length_656_cov_54.964083_g2038_i0.p1  ORF type:complete len:166 (+),score=23.40 NODE_2088_length_656_cov_54.964083_g2038_i0:79-576(+)
MQSRFLVFLALCFILLTTTRAAMVESDCPVCINFLNRVSSKMTDTSEEALTKLIKTECKVADEKEKRLCYYIGGAADAATSMLRDITRPLGNSVPSEKICERLNKKDDAICALKPEKKIDLASTDVKSLKIKDLKKILEQHGQKCVGCVDKSDYVSMVQSIKDEL